MAAVYAQENPQTLGRYRVPAPTVLRRSFSSPLF
jgi:hypothetical protein